MTFSPLRIEPLADGQYEAAAHLLTQAFNIPAARNRSELSETHGGLSQIFAAARDGKVIGIVRCHKFDNNFSVSLLAVDKAERGKGLGQHLMQHAEDFMRREWLDGKKTYISLEDETRRDNPGSRFYERLGYEEWPGMTGSSGQPLMYKWLNP
jgi:ribosomal protein S18 acetylase RimI-like enzyme